MQLVSFLYFSGIRMALSSAAMILVYIKVTGLMPLVNKFDVLDVRLGWQCSFSLDLSQ
jgi:hypothetical protein